MNGMPVSNPPALTEEERRADTRRAVAWSVFLVLITALPYLQLVNQEFTNYDDNFFVYENRYVNGGFTLEGLIWAFGFRGLSQWHPLMWMSHMLDVELFGLWAGGHKLHNLALHLANALLLFHLLRRTTAKVHLSGLVALLWAVHPLRVEVVAWVAERKELLCTFFGLWTLIAYAWYARRPGVKRYALVLLLFILCLMSKPMLVTLPCVMLLLDYWPLRRIDRFWTREERPALARLLLEKLPFVPLIALSAFLTMLVVIESRTLGSVSIVTPPMRVANALQAYLVYLRKTLLPNDLSVFYKIEFDWSMPLIALAGGLWVLATWLALRNLRKRPYATVGWLWYVGTLVPVIGLIQVGSQKYADRYTYVSIIGVLIIVVWGGAELLRRYPLKPTVLYAAIGILTTGLVFTTWLQTSYWKNSIALFTRAVDQEPDNPIALANLGSAYLDAGYSDTAMTYFHEALRHNPDQFEPTMNIGLVYTRDRRYVEAVQMFRRAIRIQPHSAPAYHNLGSALLGMGRTDLAKRSFEHALRLNPDYFHAYSGLGGAYLAEGDHARAEASFRRAVEASPASWLAHMRLGQGLVEVGKWEEGVAELKHAVELNPTSEVARAFLAAALSAPELAATRPATAPASQPQSQPSADQLISDLLPPR